MQTYHKAIHKLNEGVEHFSKYLSGLVSVERIDENDSKSVYPIYGRRSDKNKANESYPNSDKSGVYAFILPDNEDENKCVVYIGKCEGHMGNRIWSHIGRFGRENEDEYPNAEEWVSKHKDKYIAVVTMPIESDDEKSRGCFAPSLESFLIKYFRNESMQLENKL